MVQPQSIRFFLILALCSFIVACSGQGIKKDADALYYRLGARKELGKIVTDTVDFWAADQRIVGDTAIKEKMSKTDLGALKRSLFSFICWAANGPCTFKPESLDSSVQELKITQLEWYYMLEGIVSSMSKHNVPIREQNEVLAIIYSLEPKVVTH